MILFTWKHIVLGIALIIPILSIDLHNANAESSYSFESYNYPGRYIRHRNYLGEITGLQSALDRKDASFRKVAGLAGRCSSFESVNYPGHYLRHQNYRIKLNRNDGSDLFRKDATFCLKRGRADPRYTSFESYNYPGYYIRHKNFLLYIDKGQGDLFNKDTTFKFLAATSGTQTAVSSFSFESYNYPGRYIRHRNYLGEITAIQSALDRKDASFRKVAGLAGRCSSFESVNYPGHYLRHQNYRIKLNRNDGSDLFRKDATFCLKRGRADPRYTSFESYNYPGYYIRHKNFLLYIDKGQGDLFNKDTTFRFHAASEAQPAAGSFSFESYNYPGRYIRHRNYLGEITGLQSALDRKDASFRKVAGLAGRCSSFESVNYPGHYLRHQNYRIKLNRNDGSDLFRKDATFCLKRGLADPRYTSFESYNYPGYFIRHKNFLLYIDKGQGNLFNKDTTFKLNAGF